jgi:predicted AlkP superfamily pyrophosphatase or phosphodiesterase
MFGPDAPETRKEVLFVDSAINELNKAVKTTGLNVDFIFVSDHGMTKVDKENTIARPPAIDTAKFVTSGDGVMVHLYPKDPKFIKETYEQLKKEASGYKVYLTENMPEYLHYSKADDRYNRIGDILLIPDWPRVFNMYNRKPITATHGYDPALVKDMLATFYAWGPDFKAGVTIPSFKNVDVYPLITTILGLDYTEKIDGTKKLTSEVLK